jgi:DNA-binding MarR family transcriptional regulator
MSDAKASTLSTSRCTCFRVRKMARRMTMIYDAHLAPFGLTVTQFSILSSLRRADGISIGVLADYLLMDATTLTRTLKPLERKDLVIASRDPKDGRTRRLHLTEKGRVLFSEARPSWERAQLQIDTALGKSETTTLNTTLDRALARLAV